MLSFLAHQPGQASQRLRIGMTAQEPARAGSPSTEGQTPMNAVRAGGSARHLKRIDITNLDEAWVSELDLVPTRPFVAALTRLGDVITSGALLITTLPLMLLLSLIIRLD